MRRALVAIALSTACGGGPPPAPRAAPAPGTTGTKPVVPTTNEPPAPPAPHKPITNKTLAEIGLDPDALDRTADPCDDFYQFACGGWLARTEIAADKPVAMRTFVAIRDRILDYEHGLLEQARTSPGGDPIAQQLGAYYGSCMDEAAIEKAGTQPIQPLLAAVSKISDARSLSRAVATLHAQGISALFVLSATQDFADARKVIASLDQGGLGLPDRDYYLKDDDGSKGLRTGYEAFVAGMLVEAGHKPAVAKREAADVLALETEIAKVSKDKVARRDPKTMYNRLDRAGVAKAMSHFDWDGFWKTVALDKAHDITVSSPEWLAGLDALIVKTPPATWRAYLAVHTLRWAAPFLTEKLDKAAFDVMATMTGQKQMSARWRRCARRTEEALGDLLGQAFVRDRFPGASKTAADDQIQAIVAAMAANLDALPWMDAATKAKARAKLAAMSYQIGFPRKWRTYGFRLDPKAWAANALAAHRAETARELAKIGKPVDRDDWVMTTPTVDAYYDPQLNGMVFPAGILQPPFYSVDAAIPVNLGAIGQVMGHELTHGFDDQGAQYDADGNLTNWWQPDTEKEFKQRTQCVIDQYSAYDIAGGKVNGANTAGENIADIGGVKLALTAYRGLRASAPDTVVADGFTEDQQFFLAFGQAWCQKARPDFEKMLANVDVHSPAKWRVDGALAATPEFAKVFRCKAGAKLRPANACVVW